MDTSANLRFATYPYVMMINSLILAIAAAPLCGGAAAFFSQDPAVPIALPVPPSTLPQPSVALPAPLAWLTDQDDYPLVSRRLMVLEVGAVEPVCVLQPILHSFDAADYQRLAWLGNDLLVTGPVMQSRPTPNVGLPLNRVERSQTGNEEVPARITYHAESFRDLTAKHYYPSPDGQGVLIVGFGQNGLVHLQSKLHPLLPEDGINYRMRGGGWAEDGSAVYLSLGGGRGETQAGLWKFSFHGWSESATPKLGDGVRLANAPRYPRHIAADGTIFATDRVERGRFTPHEAYLWFPERERASIELADDLLYTMAAELRPGAGLGDASAATIEIAYVRTPAGELIHRSFPRNHLLTSKEATPPNDRVLWSGKHRVLSLAWSPDGEWLAISALDEQRKAQIYVVAVDEDAKPVHLGPGIRPSWGPLPAGRATPSE